MLLQLLTVAFAVATDLLDIRKHHSLQLVGAMHKRALSKGHSTTATLLQFAA